MKKEDLNDLKFLKSLFADAEPEIPEQLGESVIKQKILSHHPHKKIKPRMKIRLAPILTGAACLVVIAAVTFAVCSRIYGLDVFGVSDRVLTFRDYDEMRGVISSLNAVPSGEKGGMAGGQFQAKDDGSQVLPDMSVADGDFIYLADNLQGQNCVSIFQTDGEEAKLISTIQQVVADDFALRGIYVCGDKLAVNASGDGGTTKVRIFDTSDKSKPRPVYDYEQSGYYVKSCMIGSNIYVVSIQTAFTPDGDKMYPCGGVSNDFTPIDAKNIGRFNAAEYAQYAVIGAVRLDDEISHETKAVLGAGDGMQFGKGCVYLTNDNSSYYGTKRVITTELMRVSLNKGHIKFAQISSLGDFGGSEHMIYDCGDKIYIIASKAEENQNIYKAYVLDNRLHILGAGDGTPLGGFITSTAFIDEKAFIASAERTAQGERGKITVIDLSDPDNITSAEYNTENSHSSCLIPLGDRILSVSELIDGGNTEITLFDPNTSPEPTEIARTVCKQITVDYVGAQISSDGKRVLMSGYKADKDKRTYIALEISAPNDKLITNVIPLPDNNGYARTADKNKVYFFSREEKSGAPTL